MNKTIDEYRFVFEITCYQKQFTTDIEFLITYKTNLNFKLYSNMTIPFIINATLNDLGHSITCQKY